MPRHAYVLIDRQSIVLDRSVSDTHTQTHAHARTQVYIEDLRDEFVKDYVFWAVKVRCGDLDEAMGKGGVSRPLIKAHDDV